MEKVLLGVSDFALPAPRRGSIEAHSGLGRGAPEGQEIHRLVQTRRSALFPNYRAEVSLSSEFERDELTFEVRGRIDGLFEGSSPRIEEIKSSFNIYDLRRVLDDQPDHPYRLQLMTYGYFYWQSQQVMPNLRLHLVSSRNGESFDYEVPFDFSFYEAWLGRRLQELVEEVRDEKKRIARRKKAATKLVFPFSSPRPGQIELIQTIEEGMSEERPMLLQAPTGLGKTMGVLYPTMKEALGRGQKVVYVTPKNSQHAVAEEAIEKLQDQGAPVRALTITAKSKMCLKNEPLCHPDYCEYAKDHYTKVAANDLPGKLAKKKNLTSRVFRKMGLEYEVCPFELQLDAAQGADTVICDYNYVFAPRSAFGRLARNGLLPSGKPNLVIDEAHNLPARALDYYSPSISAAVLERMREETRTLPGRFRKQALEQIESCLSVLRQCGAGEGAESGKARQIAPPFGLFLDQDSELRTFLSAYLSSDVEIQAQDVVMRLCFYWAEFTEALAYVRENAEEGRFFTTYSPSPATIKITCCDASEMLEKGYEEYAHVVAFSATLKPFEFYSQLGGLRREDLKTAEFTSPFPRENRKIIVIPQISSKYSERERNYPRIAEAIEKISSLKSGNYIAFFPSFDFMEKVLARVKAPAGMRILRQQRSMKRDEIDEVLQTLKDPAGAHLLFAVQGGVFSEGVDFPGRMVIGVFVVGPPLPNFDLEREKMREYYQEKYDAGFDYAYTYPAMAKAVQAAGRVIRSETDQGIIVLMDDRFTQTSYAKSMPGDWFGDSPRELVSQSILKDIADFWARCRE